MLEINKSPYEKTMLQINKSPQEKNILQIKKFPHAHYDPSHMSGFLCYYYAYRDLDLLLWRDQSYSPEVLNYKEGKREDIMFFVEPYLQLLNFVMRTHKVRSACLIPVPGSIPPDHPDYTRQPKDISGKNRDDRNIMFCNLLIEKHTKYKLSTVDLLQRTVRKPALHYWDIQTQFESLACVQSLPRSIGPKTLLILIDDIVSSGSTLDACQAILGHNYPDHKIIQLPIASTIRPGYFRPLHPGQPALRPEFQSIGTLFKPRAQA